MSNSYRRASKTPYHNSSNCALKKGWHNSLHHPDFIPNSCENQSDSTAVCAQQIAVRQHSTTFLYGTNEGWQKQTCIQIYFFAVVITIWNIWWLSLYHSLFLQQLHYLIIDTPFSCCPAENVYCVIHSATSCSTCPHTSANCATLTKYAHKIYFIPNTIPQCFCQVTILLIQISQLLM